MKISEAVQLAMKNGKYIQRETIEGTIGSSFHPTKIKPTNSYGFCIVYTLDEKGNEIHHCKNWNPSAEDLMADDWVLTD